MTPGHNSQTADLEPFRQSLALDRRFRPISPAALSAGASRPTAFAPDLLTSFGLKGDASLYGGALIIALLFVVGGFPGLYLVERIGRRKLLLGSFAVIAVALAIPIVVPHVPAWLFFLALAAYAFSRLL